MTKQSPSRSNLPHVAVLGAGPAGAAAALKLVRDGKARVTVLERQGHVGGNAASFQHRGIWCDYGSHRFHPVADPQVLDDVKSLLGDDLLWRRRHGRILLQKRWIHFPLKPFDLLLRLPMRFTTSLLIDTVTKLLPKKLAGEENFATILQRGLGRTISESFYYPYVRKLWGLDPTELAVTLAHKRVSGSSISKILRKVMRQFPGLKSETAGGFFYPRQGFGQVSNALHQAAAQHGAEFILGATVTGVQRNESGISGVSYEKGGKVHHAPVDALWSTLPITLLARMMDPPAPPTVLEAADQIKFRGMILIYLVLEQSQFTEYDAHYFPELSIPISRMSEPKNYSGATEPANLTVLCAELPADPGEAVWSLTDEQIGQRFCEWLASVGLPVTVPVKEVFTRRLSHAYPVYDRDYERHFQAIDEWLGGIDGLLTFGRQGLFAHDNTHHAMVMAYDAGECFGKDGSFDRARWARYREEFESHVVED